MAATKSGSAVISAQTSSAGSTYASPSSGCQSSSQTMTTYYGATVTGQVTNGSSAPGVGTTAQIDISYDGSTWRQYTSWQAGVTASTSYQFAAVLDPAVMNWRITFFGNTTNSTTVSAEVEYLTGI